MPYGETWIQREGLNHEGHQSHERLMTQMSIVFVKFVHFVSALMLIFQITMFGDQNTDQ
jgi:hypothetical protein